MHPTLNRDPEYILWRRKKTQVEMMQDRKYIVNKEERAAILSKKNFIEYYRNVGGDLDMIYTHQQTEEKISVIYNILLEGLILNKSDVSTVISDMQTEYDTGEADSFILIVDEIPKSANMFKEVKFRIQIFEFSALGINPAKHIFTQQHRIYSPVEKASFYEETGFESKMMPGIALTSALMKYYDAKQKDLVHIIRDPILNGIIDRHEYYREVRDISQFSSGMDGGDDEEQEDENAEDVEEEIEDEGEEY